MTRNNSVGRKFDDRNEKIVNFSSSINWRASLVPAAAVIPAPVAYIKFVAVKKLVVGFMCRLAFQAKMIQINLL